MKETYLTVAGRIRREIEDVQDIVERVLDIWREHERSPDGYYVDAAALNLHGFYAGLERIFEVVASRIDRTLPDGAQWHQELLDQMDTEIPSTRPAVLSPSTRRRLDRYRGFRHVVRNVYTVELDPQQVALLVKDLPETAEQVTGELRSFADALERIARGDAGDDD